MRVWALASCGSLLALTACSAEKSNPEVPQGDSTEGDSSVVLNTGSRPGISLSPSSPRPEAQSKRPLLAARDALKQSASGASRSSASRPSSAAALPKRQHSQLLKARLNQIRAQRANIPNLSRASVVPVPPPPAKPVANRGETSPGSSSQPRTTGHQSRTAPLTTTPLPGSPATATPVVPMSAVPRPTLMSPQEQNFHARLAPVVSLNSSQASHPDIHGSVITGSSVGESTDLANGSARRETDPWPSETVTTDSGPTVRSDGAGDDAALRSTEADDSSPAHHSFAAHLQGPTVAQANLLASNGNPRPQFSRLQREQSSGPSLRLHGSPSLSMQPQRPEANRLVRPTATTPADRAERPSDLSATPNQIAELPSSLPFDEVRNSRLPLPSSSQSEAVPSPEAAASENQSEGMSTPPSSIQTDRLTPPAIETDRSPAATDSPSQSAVEENPVSSQARPVDGLEQVDFPDSLRITPDRVTFSESRPISSGSQEEVTEDDEPRQIGLQKKALSRILCRMEGSSSGDAKILVMDFLENPSGHDAVKTQGKVTDKDLVIRPSGNQPEGLDPTLSNKAKTCPDGTKPLAQIIPDAATAGTPIPGRVESPTR